MEVVGEDVPIGGSAYVFSRHVFIRARAFVPAISFKNSTELVVHDYRVAEEQKKTYHGHLMEV